LVLDQSGKVGIGTLTPGSALEVQGNLAATGQISAQSLTLPGLGTLTDLQSLLDILKQAPTDTASQKGTGSTPSTPTTPVPTPPPTTKPEADPVKLARLEGSVPAGPQWQELAGPFSGYTALEVTAWVGHGNDKSICHGTAVNIDGDPYDQAIQLAQSYKGRSASKIQLRWRGNAKAYYLECRTRLKFPFGTKVQFRIEEKK
jgi:hypothetical protein